MGRRFPGRTLLVALAALGALLSVLLELIHYRAYVAPSAESFCSIGARLDCGAVALSRYAVWLGVPLPVWGLAGFVTLGLCAWQGSRWLLPLAGAAASVGVALTVVSAWAVGAWCLPCELAHVTSLAILVLAWRARAVLPEPFAALHAPVLASLPSFGLLLGGVLLPAYWGAFSWKSALPFNHGKTEDGHPWIGAVQPKLTLEEFVDYSCPHCKAASSRHLMRLAAHPHELRIVRRHYPRTSCNPHIDTSCLALRIALCADEQDRFWQADRWLFEHADDGRDLGVALAAHDLGLDAARLSSCVARDSTFERAAAEWKQARKLHIPGTPYYLADSRAVTTTAALALIDAL